MNTIRKLWNPVAAFLLIFGFVGIARAGVDLPLPPDDRYDYQIQRDMAAGDAQMVTLVTGWNIRAGEFVAVIEPGRSLDIEAKGQITGVLALYDLNTVKIDDVVASAAGLPGYKLYVGANAAPDGWSSTLLTDTWFMTVTMPFTTPIDVAADWSAIGVKYGGKHVFKTATDEYGIIQSWDGRNSKVVMHTIIFPGTVLTITGRMQGTMWKVVLDDPADEATLIARFDQMRHEVEIRDADRKTGKPPKILTYSVCFNPPPNGWNAVPTPKGWSFTCDPAGP